MPAPEEIETDVAKRIEDAMMSIDGLKHISSSCMENVNQTLLEFELDIDVDIAATDVREKLDLIRADFPEDVEDPEILKFDVNAKPVVIMALTGDAPIDDLYDYAKNEFKDRITRIAGVAEVELVGGAEREVHVLADRKKLEARGLSIMDLYRAIKTGVRTIPSGRIQDETMEYNVKFKADFDSIADIEEIEIAGENGQRCLIGDIGRVEMTTAELRQMAAVDGRPAISVSVIKKADANTAAVTQRVNSVMIELESALPGGMELVWVTDDGHFVEATVHSAWMGVGMGVVLTAFILFFFLYNFRNLLIVGITMPLTIVIGLFFMEQVGFTLNTSTLIAVAMSVGILVTNSIVVLEAITKRIKEDIDPKEASALGARETVIAVLASAGTNVVVLFPLTLMASRVGMFIKPLALTYGDHDPGVPVHLLFTDPHALLPFVNA